MSTSHKRQVALVLSVAAAAVAGCGSSSSTTTTSTASTPASSSTPTTFELDPTGEVDAYRSAAFYDFALRVATNSAPQLNARQSGFAAHCFQKGFLAAGFKTQGDLELATNGDKERGITVACILKAQRH